MTVTVLDSGGAPQAGLPVYAFDGTTYTNFTATTDAEGKAVMTLPQSSYRFRADKEGVQYWSGEDNHCPIPGCLNAAITVPGGGASLITTTITYTYDGLKRLTAADYDSGEYFHYTYDDVGNRLTEEKKTTPDGLVENTAYTYDDANRMTSAGGVTYMWDDKGNLLDDGVNTYTYNHANKLTMVDGPSSIAVFVYNGLGDRLSESINGATVIFTLDINTGLTQVLADGSHVYLYGLGRITQTSPTESVYFLGDVLGSVRQLADGQGIVILARSYEPYGSVLSTAGEDTTKYGFTGEWQDEDSLFLRAREYNTQLGIFISKDIQSGVENRPISQNPWIYGWNNPLKYTDPSGQSPWWCDGWGDIALIEMCERYWFDLNMPLLPNFDNIGVDQPPTSTIQWNPSVYTKPSSRLHTGWNASNHPGEAAQYSVKDRDSNEYTTRYGSKLCGQISLSYILEGVTGNSYALNDILDVDGDISKYACGRDAEGYPYLTSRCYLERIMFGYNESKGAFINKAVGSYIDGIISTDYIFWHSQQHTYTLENDMHLQMENMLRQGHYIIALTMVQLSRQGSYLPGDIVAPNKNLLHNSKGVAYWGHYWGSDPKATADVAGHWIVITGFSSPWIQGNDNSPGNWVRIMNPFYNREEYYPWSILKGSMIKVGSGPYLLEIWAEKLNVISPCR